MRRAWDWIPSQGPWWELPEACNVPCRKVEKFSSYFFLLQPAKELCETLEILLLLPGPCCSLGFPVGSRACVFQLCSDQQSH